ncbi:LacI family DNA-binding transcriptional regulator [Paracoccus laeviglucosivorans]|uniref:Monosaccharide ABC transporter substrate-binding protein, CUT2 family n=1 Tax=Paracoccus laeviglucosivorans TaxID=1197861 RepID=A0A521EBJ9_9RHOB|nr:LacI family DNA-binding transcriptional regulator [Paracoccus laeviglucosivorans]SMO81259.1 monosaccharide ABC transporter substrate-binding protein, CUT2 family [Paracoccus laeviglucosivorans]
MIKPTLQNIAQRAGVGTATVERVLNGRGGVRPELVERVVTAARALNYSKKLPDSHHGLYRIEVMLVRPETTFYRRLGKAFERIAATLDPVIVVHRTFTEEMNPRQIATRIASTAMRRAGLILAVPDNPEIRAAVEAVAANGLPVVNVVTRASDRAGEFVGIDNYAAGRSAALFTARMARGRGPVMALGHPIYRVHRERIAGFSDYLRDHPAKGLEFNWMGFSLDDESRSADLLFAALKRHPDMAALYNAGGANAALIDVLRRDPRGRDIFYVGHELTDYTDRALRDGVMDVVLDQAPEAQARRAIDLVLRRIGLTGIEPDTSPIRFVTITAESL